MLSLVYAVDDAVGTVGLQQVLLGGSYAIESGYPDAEEFIVIVGIDAEKRKAFRKNRARVLQRCCKSVKFP